MSQVPDPRFSPGAVLRGKYRVDRVLGTGGMGMVLGAWHLRLEQRVAIKVLRPEMAAQPDIVRRFEREAHAASRLESEHVARVMDVDTLDDGTSFLVMEFLEGRDLSFVRRARTPLDPAQAVGCVLQACRAIADAHAAGVIHRDLKPANLFVARRRDGGARIKVLDFGISKVTTADVDGHGTQTAAMIGSADYMSPEQMTSSRDVDARTDIWSLGVVLFELCTATTPFAGATMPQVCAAVMTMQPPAPRSIRPEIDPGLEAVILRCLRKEPAERYASVAELARALAPFGPEDVDAIDPRPAEAASEPQRAADGEAPTEASGGGVSTIGGLRRPSEAVIVVGGGAPSESASTTVALSSIAPPPPQAPTRSRAGVVAGALIAGVVLVAALSFARRGQDAPGAAATSGVVATPRTAVDGTPSGSGAASTPAITVTPSVEAPPPVSAAPSASAPGASPTPSASSAASASARPATGPARPAPRPKPRTNERPTIE
jgi:serine/threonine-protein kinase